MTPWTNSCIVIVNARFMKIISVKQFRLKVLGKLPDDKARANLTKLHTSLNDKSLEDFFHQVDVMCGSGQLEVVLRKPDKKKERFVIANTSFAN